MELINGITSQDGIEINPTEVVAPRRLNPFPYSNYYMSSFVDPAESYYNDPSLDAVTLKVTLGGDNNAWSDLGSFFDLGLLTPTEAINPATAYYASGALYDTGDILDGWRWLGYFQVDDPVQKLRYSVAGQNDLGPGAQTIYLPGVASLTGYYYSNYNSVIYKGLPVWFELEFQQNEYKSNPNLYYSGYTNFGDFNSAEFGYLYTPTPGYTRRYVAGFIKKDADLATCTVEDIMLGAIWNAEDLGGGVYNGVGHVVLNGVIRGTMTFSDKPQNVEMYMDPITNNYAYELGDNPQFWWNGVEISVSSGVSSTYVYSEPAYANGGGFAFDSVDVYDIKYAWYIDYVPDAGPGPTVGGIDFYIPMMYTHPGYYFD